MYRSDEEADGDVPEGVPVEERREKEVTNEEKKVYVTTKLVPPKDFTITKEDVKRHGLTRGCAGCRSCFYGVARQPHNVACREKFREIMRKEAKVKNAEKRKEEFEKKTQQMNSHTEF